MTRKTTPAASPLAAYLRDINEVALLTRAEEQRLARAFREGDRRAGHRLVEANLRFVVKVALDYRWYGLPMPDLVQEGNIGLMKGVQKFDPDKQIRLISYAVWWIRAYIQNHVLKSWSLVKIGTTQTQRKLFFSLARTRREIERLSAGAEPDAPDGQNALVAKKLKVKESDVVDMQQRLEARDFSLDAPVADGTTTHLDSTASAHALQDEELARAEEEALLARRVGDAMDGLDPRERYIVRTRIMGEGSVKLRELGRHFGFSRERARQLEVRALERLRRELAPDAYALGWPSASRTEDRRPAARSARPDARRQDGLVPTLNGEVS